MCPDNTFSEGFGDVETACTPCDEGRYISHSNASGHASPDQCSPCEQGAFLNGSSCAVCGSGRFIQTTGASACSLCPSGKYLSDDGINITNHDDASDCEFGEAAGQAGQP